MSESKFQGMIPLIVENREGLYEGNLAHYFRIIWDAPNINHPYHNLQHMLHIMYLCYQACLYYAGMLSPRKMRNLLIGAMFHDYDHTGTAGDDARNIARAIQGVKKHLLPEDRPYEDEIIAMIRGSQYPYVIPVEELAPEDRILRDADVSQAFSVAWIQIVILGLAREAETTPVSVLRKQRPFLTSTQYLTAWARSTFTPLDIAAKIAEAEALLALLEEPAPATV